MRGWQHQFSQHCFASLVTCCAMVMWPAHSMTDSFRMLFFSPSAHVFTSTQIQQDIPFIAMHAFIPHLSWQFTLHDAISIKSPLMRSQSPIKPRFWRLGKSPCYKSTQDRTLWYDQTDCPKFVSANDLGVKAWKSNERVNVCAFCLTSSTRKLFINAFLILYQFFAKHFASVRSFRQHLSYRSSSILLECLHSFLL